MRYSKSAHTRFYHRFHVVWATKYRYKVLGGAMRERIREIIMQTCNEMGVHIVKGVLARDHVHMFLSIPPKLSLSNVMQRIKGRSSRRIQMEFPELWKQYWGRRFWARGYFSTTSGNVTDDVIKQYLELHSSKLCFRHLPEVLHLSSGTSGTFNASARRVFAEPGRKGFC
jgi:putative transposase